MNGTPLIIKLMVIVFIFALILHETMRYVTQSTPSFYAAFMQRAGGRLGYNGQGF
jgi:hypothetical protein